jgi:hypothetical protein
MSWVVYPAEEQSKPEGKVLIAIQRHIKDGRIEVIEGFVHVHGSADLGDKLASYVDAIVAGLPIAGPTLPVEASKPQEEAKPSESAEALMLGILGLPQGPWPCKGRCGKVLDWPGVCPECYRATGEVLAQPNDALGSIPVKLRTCCFDNPSWQQNISTEAKKKAFALVKANESIEISGDDATSLGVAIFLAKLKELKNNNDARYVRPSELTTASARQMRERPLLVMDYVNARVSSAIAKDTLVIACGYTGTTIKEKIRTWT